MLQVLGIPYDPAIVCSFRRCENCSAFFEVKNIVFEDYHSCLDSVDPGSHLDIRVRKRDGFCTLPTSGYSSLMPYQSPQVKDTMNKVFAFSPPQLIVDCTSHIGGDAIHFAKIFPKSIILAIDVDSNAIACLEQNIRKCNLNPERFHLINADCTSWIKAMNQTADLYYFDPPWGGPEYLMKENVRLKLGGEDISNIINYILEHRLSPHIILKAPRNFAFVDFEEDIIGGKTRLFFIKKPQKGGVVAYVLIHITPSE